MQNPDDKKIEDLISLKGPNGPDTSIECKGKGKQEYIDKRERIERRKALSRLIAHGKSDDEIFETMSAVTGDDAFGMSRSAVKKMMHEMFSRWAEEDEEREPYQKNAAKRRIYNHIERAAEDGKWSAVANFEKVLSRIEGTEEPIEVVTHPSERISDAVREILGEEDPAKIREMIDSEVRLLEESKTQKPTIYVNGKSIVKNRVEN